MAQHATEDLKPFRLGSNHSKGFLTLALVGIVLFVLGIGLSFVKLAGEEEETHAPAPAAAPAGEHGGAGEHHSDAGTGKMAQYASADHAATTPAEGGATAEATHHEAHHIFDDTTESGTWRRAHWHEDNAIEAHHEARVPGLAAKIGVSLMIGGYWWFAVALFGVFFIAVCYTANAGWYLPIKRILENYYRFLPIGIAIMLAVFFGFGSEIYEWMVPGIGEHDALIHHKEPFLNVAFILGTGLLLVGLWAFCGHLLKQQSKKEDVEGGLANYMKSKVVSVAFLPLFGFGFSFFIFLWIMSVDPHWFSTIFAVYCFAGLFVSGMTVTMFITTGLKREGYLPSFGADHLHDIGKFMFAFSVFWAYIWVSQYLLIWYANIPEETIYYYNRFQDYKLLFAVNVLINFVFPFISLMPREAKRKIESLRSVGRVMLFGRFLDAFLLLVPGALGAAGGFHVMLMAAGAVCLVGAIFLFVVYKGFEDAPIEARKHPFFEESLHHNTGV
jgi:hypothetical protein